jgi:hypothetical protein
MLYLSVLEWAFGCFILAFVSWQIVWPLLQGRAPFSKKPKNGKGK